MRQLSRARLYLLTAAPDVCYICIHSSDVLGD
jgi:hypothetical protein